MPSDEEMKMARFAVVPLSRLAAANRLDASFHVALDEVRDRVEELASTLTPDEARERLARIEVRDKQSLRAIARGTRGALDAAAIGRLVEEYPHLSLALVEAGLGPSVERVRKEIARNEAALEALLAISPGAVRAPAP